ncbi:cyclic phosphodiesterase-like domain-containing [Leptolyngbya sp. Heron Island J]|uniref:cyclic phosphodiesterase-like domain-containing n=1 Tax=Leptolyngbya sp. Heron Island J TaxID=1385935 RepID=UPI0003B99C66|nr:cyclic phosphodiesterase-like domain-containing [Leptolyngbya sp. Heron Island J]ESA35239.1 cyclic phosphodiesterase-like domain-containing [Leptolyngbya sp. Heron Island J]
MGVVYICDRMPDAYYSFWLIPQEPDLDNFQAIINSLAERFGTVPFSPHVTLYSGPFPAAVTIEQVCATLAAIAPIALEVVKFSYESRFSRTLYVQLTQALPFTQLVSRLVDSIPGAQMPVLDPHISLLYHNLDIATKHSVIGSISLPRSTIRFNQVQVIATPKNFETQDHVASLRCVHSQWLTSS